jgi:hypothetical protein
MFRGAVVLSVVAVLLAAIALISCLSVEDRRTIRGLPRVAWVVAILLVPVAGPVAWFLRGRPRPAGRPGPGWRGSTGLPQAPRPRAPDDDPEFLRSLDLPALDKDDEDLLRRWEEDLRRREDEQRRRDSGGDG